MYLFCLFWMNRCSHYGNWSFTHLIGYKSRSSSHQWIKDLASALLHVYHSFIYDRIFHLSKMIIDISVILLLMFAQVNYERNNFSLSLTHTHTQVCQMTVGKKERKESDSCLCLVGKHDGFRNPYSLVNYFYTKCSSNTYYLQIPPLPLSLSHTHTNAILDLHTATSPILSTLCIWI